eukprot:363828-Chlamydomonas_euryale.AAC.1
MLIPQAGSSFCLSSKWGWIVSSAHADSCLCSNLHSKLNLNLSSWPPPFFGPAAPSCLLDHFKHAAVRVAFDPQCPSLKLGNAPLRPHCLSVPLGNVPLRPCAPCCRRLCASAWLGKLVLNSRAFVRPYALLVEDPFSADDNVARTFGQLVSVGPRSNALVGCVRDLWASSASSLDCGAGCASVGCARDVCALRGVSCGLKPTQHLPYSQDKPPISLGFAHSVFGTAYEALQAAQRGDCRLDVVLAWLFGHWLLVE